MFNTEALALFRQLEARTWPPLACCGCGQAAEGNVGVTEPDGSESPVCDACHAEWTTETP